MLSPPTMSPGWDPSLLGLLCYFVVALLLYAVMAVPVIQLALGQRKEGALLHFAFGPAEWRLFRAVIGLAAFLSFRRVTVC